MQFTHSFPLIRPLLSKSDKEKLEQLFLSNYQLIRHFQDITISNILLEYHLEDSNIIAAFDIIHSSETTHHFHLYPRFFALIEQDLHRLEAIILHEIIHGIDLSMLHKQHTLAQVESISTQHAFVHFLATIRNEGVAILVQKLLHKESVSIASPSAFLTLENELNTILRSCISNTIHQRISWSEFQSILYQLHKNVYQYADVIAFTFSAKQLGFPSDIEFNAFIHQASQDEKKKLITHLLSMDVSEWIQQLIRIEQSNVIRLEIKLELLIHLCALLNPKIHKEHHTILDDIPRYAYQNDSINVIRILEQIVPQKQGLNEIRTQLENTTDFQEDIELEIALLCQKLLLHRNEKTMHLIDLALTYYLSKQDVIHDETLFLGKQDDWIVLESVYILLNLHQPNN